jgi:hypothetical protein
MSRNPDMVTEAEMAGLRMEFEELRVMMDEMRADMAEMVSPASRVHVNNCL